MHIYIYIDKGLKDVIIGCDPYLINNLSNKIQGKIKIRIKKMLQEVYIQIWVTR